ncbi:unnamed protein product [Caenorhabditis angaria]|uniref:BTB domain-containing protein n=1 Tax=Caenorhabditis angaria TaxID=860376 RepID=A0A9P1IBM8_9PELO|nr:unnamed protein product [Caenorhabditis angaria]
MHPIVCNGNKLKWKFDNIKNLGEDRFSSDKFTIGPVDWVIDISAGPNNNNVKCLVIWLRYDSANKDQHNWVCDARGKFKLLKQNGLGKHEVEDLEIRYQGVREIWGADMLQMRKVLDSSSGFMIEDSVVVEIEFNFKYHDFSKNVENFTDIKINVQDTDFYLNKGVLSSKSEYFYDLFVNNKYTETSKKLEDVTAEELCCILVSYPCVDPLFEKFLDDYIETANTYGVPSLHDTCEKYLISNNNMEIMDKIKYVEDNGYEKVLEDCIEKLKSPVEIKKLHTDPRFDKLKDDIKLKIMNRLLDMF